MRKTFHACLVWLCGAAASAFATDSQLQNLSTRGQVGADSAVMIAGFVIADGPKQVLIRAVGPGLTQFGLQGVLENPDLALLDASNQVIAANDDWLEEDATVFNQVGAFDIVPGSRDSALVITLEPGAYTARVSGVSGGTGVALVEVYDVDGVGGVSRLLNLSARAEVGVGDDVLIPGLVLSPGDGPRRLLIRAVGPTLEEFQVEGALADPKVSVVDVTGRTLMANDNWGSPDAASIAALGAMAGAFELPDPESRDAALFADLNPGAYTVQVSGAGDATGVVLVEVFDATPSVPTAEISITPVDTVADESGTNNASVVVTRSGETTEPLIVKYSVTGTAFNAVDYLFLSGALTIPAGQASASINIIPVPDIVTEPVENLTISLFPALGYTITGSSEVAISIANSQPVLYVASLRPEAGAASSTGYGTATILMSSDGAIGSVNLSVANLSSAQTTAYLRLGEPGQVGDYILGLPLGQVEGVIWQVRPTGLHSAEDLINALENGSIYVGIETTAFPDGELRGHFIRSSGSDVFSPPADPPPAPQAPATAADASRFLTQATFGPRREEIDALMSKTYSQWIDEQMALPASSHLAATDADWAAHPTNGRANNTRPGREHRQSAWWSIALNGQDQLRQRVAFALSEIFVVSDENAVINNWQRGAANYYDILADEAFGNYRSLLERVSRSPVMGIYLSHLRNSRANPETGALPDENYAREVMQLFSIGLVQLQPDGTLKLDTNGLPIPTYDQTTITEMAKVFTGWAFHTADPNPPDRLFRRGAADYISPMSLYPNFHEDGPKTIVNGVEIPAGLGGEEDLRIALDTLFNHPNTPAFICRRLIQRLVTSNPSPGYVYRVARVFEDNGQGVRGDLGAVVRAILLDYEARDPAVTANAGSGKLREPILRLTNLLRSLHAEDPGDGRFNLTNPQNALAQAALHSPTVFNFFEPDYVMPGDLAAAGLFAPEFQILTSTTALTVPNYFYSFLFAARPPAGIVPRLESLTALLDDVQALLEELSLILAGGALSQECRDTIAAALGSLPPNTSAIDRVRTAVYLVMNCPDAAIQR